MQQLRRQAVGIGGSGQLAANLRFGQRARAVGVFKQFVVRGTGDGIPLEPVAFDVISGNDKTFLGSGRDFSRRNRTTAAT